jgi:hypothetical protein
MNHAVGIFTDQRSAQAAWEKLRRADFKDENLVMLTPEQSPDQVETIATEDGEQPGMGKAIGSIAGGAVGLAGGAIVGSLLLPGVGPILAIGLGAGVLGLGGAVAGGAAGDLFERMLTHGVPKDEIFLYEDALKKGRSLIIVSSESDERIEQARAIMDQEGAESVDAARKQWWIGLRDAEEAEYDSPDGSFADIEATYRRGFEAALEPQCRGKSWHDAVAILRARHGALCEQDAFRRGYERGQAYLARWSGPGESRQQSLR